MGNGIYPQTSVAQFQTPGIAGMPYDAAYAADDGAAVVSESAGLEAGVAVIYDSTPGPVASLVPGYAQKVKLPVDATSVVAGFSIYQAIKEPTSPRFSQYDALSFRKKGRIYALVQNAVTAGDDVYAWYAASGGTKGAIRSDAGSTQAVKVRGAKVLIGAATGGAAVIEINLPLASADASVASGGSWNVTTVKTGAYTAVIGDLVQVDTTGGAVTVTLPTAVGHAGGSIRVFDEGGDAGTNNITVARTGGQTINPAARGTISTNGQMTEYTSDGANWVASVV